MPIIYDTIPDEQIVVIRHIGDIPDSEFLTAYKELLGSPDFSVTPKLLVDLRQTTSKLRSTGALQELAVILIEKYRGSEERRKVAVIAPADLSFGLARMYEIFSADLPWEFGVFRDNDSALIWLGSPGTLDGQHHAPP